MLKPENVSNKEIASDTLPEYACTTTEGSLCASLATSGLEESLIINNITSGIKEGRRKSGSGTSSYVPTKFCALIFRLKTLKNWSMLLCV